MTSATSTNLTGVGGPFNEVCQCVLDATTNLLGSTITFSEDDWAAPSALPSWSRAHIASHLSNSALGLHRVIAGLLADKPATMYELLPEVAIEIGATRRALDLQIDLDTSAHQLASALNDLPAERFNEPVTLHQDLQLPVKLLPLVRLTEVILHHWDLKDGYSLDDVDTEPVLWCLELKAKLLRGDRKYPAIRLIALEGLDITIGRDGPPMLARGDARTLLGWLTGRGNPPDGQDWGTLPLI